LSKLRTKLVVVVVLVTTLLAITILTNQQPESKDTEPDTPVNPKPEPKLDTVISRESKLPDDLMKQTPDSDISPPVLHSFLWEDPVPLRGDVNTVGGEDSAFIMPDGETLYFFFTPDVRKPAEQQILDEVTGIWVARKQGDEWGDVERVKLIDKGISLDGAQFVNEEEIWFASVRLGNYNEIDYYIADIVDGEYVNVRNAEELNTDIQVGELHLTSDRQTLYFHSYREGGMGDMDIWKIEREGDGWSEPVNVKNINSEVVDGYPYVSEDMTELWLTRWYMGTPAIFRSVKTEDEWGTPKLIVSTFAGESTLDNAGNLLFTHHFYKDAVMLEADIYVAYRKPEIQPADDLELPNRGYYLGVLPIPSDEQDFTEAYAQAAETCEIIPVWGRPTHFILMADELEDEWGEGFVETLTRGNGMAPLLHFSFIDAGVTLNIPPHISYPMTLSHPEWRRMYKRAIIESVEVSKPMFLSVGNEVNRWYEKHGYEGENGFQHWVSLYEEIYDEVKELSPKTQVFCTFSREIVSENREADLSVLDYFDPEKLDILVFTTYPHSVQGVNNPTDIPDDYYSRLSERIPGKPIGFSEASWPSTEVFGGEAAQVEFLDLLTGDLTIDRGVELELVMWPWLHDLTETDDTGLIKRDGTPKEAYHKWVEISNK